MIEVTLQLTNGRTQSVHYPDPEAFEHALIVEGMIRQKLYAAGVLLIPREAVVAATYNKNSGDGEQRPPVEIYYEPHSRSEGPQA